MSNIAREELLVQIRHMFESAWQDGTMHESPKYVRRDHLFTEKTLKLIDQYTQGKVDEATRQKTPTRRITDWWITTEFFAQGGKKIAGPFKSRKTALNERLKLEKQSRTTYAIDTSKRKVKKLAKAQLADIKEKK